MAAVWPVDVPYMPDMDSDSGEPFREPLSTDMEDGNRRRRRVSTKNVAELEMSIDMTEAQFATFKAWVRDELFDGTIAFTMPIYTEGSYQTRNCSFVHRYKFAGAGFGRKRVSLVLDVDDF